MKIRKQSFCAIFCILLLLTTASVNANITQTQEEIDSLREQASQIDEARKNLNTQLTSIASDKSKAMEQKSLLEEGIALILEQISVTEKQINLLDVEILQKTAEVHEAEREETTLYRLFCERVRTLEEEGEVSYWSILFSAASFSDLLDRIAMIDEIMDYDDMVMDSLVALRESIESERERLQGLLDEQTEVKVLQEESHKDLEVQEAQVVKIIAEITAQEDQITALRNELDNASSAISTEIKKKEQEILSYWLSQGGTGDVSSTGFLWPLPAYSSLSSLYGGRIHPIYGTADNHSGIDIPAPSGTPILAAKDGIVSTSVSHVAYGNYVVVTHGEGASTLYAHMVRLGLPEGTIVKQGDVVGYVGTTGWSTGNHLHYEVRLNNALVDPINLYPGKALYISGALIT